MRQIRFNISTGVVEVNYPNTMTADDLQDFRDAMAVTFRILERTATNEHRHESEATGYGELSQQGVEIN